MRLAFLLIVVCATPLAAQNPDFARAREYQVTREDTAAILRAVADGDWEGRGIYVLGDTAWAASTRRTKPGDTTVTYYNGQRMTTVKSVFRGYYRVERRRGVWTLVPSEMNANRRLSPGVPRDTAQLRADSGRVRP